MNNLFNIIFTYNTWVFFKLIAFLKTRQKCMDAYELINNNFESTLNCMHIKVYINNPKTSLMLQFSKGFLPLGSKSGSKIIWTDNRHTKQQNKLAFLIF